MCVCVCVSSSVFFFIFSTQKEDEKGLKVCENWASLRLKCLWEP